MTLVERARENPAATFGSPANVVASGELSRDEKIEILRRWEYDARLLEVAQEENMTAPTPGLLSDVLDALHALKPEELPSAPTKSGGTSDKADVV